MTPEEGLEGCWFSATIRQLAGGWALVAYAELKESAEDSSPPLREWFPVPGQAQAAPPPRAAPGADGEPPNAVEGGAMRPVPPAEVRKTGGPCRLTSLLNLHLHAMAPLDDHAACGMCCC